MLKRHSSYVNPSSKCTEKKLLEKRLGITATSCTALFPDLALTMKFTCHFINISHLIRKRFVLMIAFYKYHQSYLINQSHSISKIIFIDCFLQISSGTLSVGGHCPPHRGSPSVSVIGRICHVVQVIGVNTKGG